MDIGGKMSDYKEDIRIIKTKQALTLALFRLLEKRNFQEITVHDVCQDALVSRSTFYIHFNDKYDLLKFCLLDLQQKFKEYSKDLSPKEALSSVYEFIHHHSSVFLHIFSSETNQELHQLFQDLIVNQYLALLENLSLGKNFSNTPASVLAVYHAGGSANLLLWWVNQQFKPSKEEMASYQLSILHPLFD